MRRSPALPLFLFIAGSLLPLLPSDGETSTITPSQQEDARRQFATEASLASAHFGHPGDAAWMPDVAGRLAELKARLEVVTEEDRQQSRREAAPAQWWREVVTLPRAAVDR